MAAGTPAPHKSHKACHQSSGLDGDLGDRLLFTGGAKIDVESTSNRFRRLDRYVSALIEGMHILAAYLLFALAFLILVDVVLRFLGRPISGTAEIVANAVVAIAFLQLPHAVRCGGFLRVEMLDGVLPAFPKRVLWSVSCVLGVALFCAVAYSSWAPMVDAWLIGEFDGVEGSLRVPTAPVRTVIVVASLVAAFNFGWMLLLGVTPDEMGREGE